MMMKKMLLLLTVVMLIHVSHTFENICLSFYEILWELITPTFPGILVTVYSSNNNDPELMAAGIVLMVLPIIALPIVSALVLNRRRLQKMRKRKVSATPERKPQSQQKY